MRLFVLTVTSLVLLLSLASPSASAQDHPLFRRAAYCNRLLDTGFNRPAGQIAKLWGFIKSYQKSHGMSDELTNRIGTDEATKAMNLYWAAIVTHPTRLKLGEKLGEEYEYCKRLADNPLASEAALRENRDHNTQLGSSLYQACVQQYINIDLARTTREKKQKLEYCGCLDTGITASSLSSEDQTLLVTNFTFENLQMLVKKYPQMESRITRCWQ